MLKKTILRIIAFALVLAMLASFAVACNKDTGNSGNDDQQSSGGNTDEGGDKPDDPNGGGEVITDDDPVKVLDGLPDQDMQGYEFTVLCRENTVFLREATADSDTGDQVDQAVYDRNFYVEDRYNCFLMTAPVTESPESTLTSTYNKSVSVGENAYQLALGHMMYTASECLNGTMLNLKLLPSIDLTKDYWHQSMNDAATINNKIFFTASDYCTSSTYYTYVMTFNMDACEERGIDVYGMVNDGTWTIDALWEIASKSYEDDGDNVVEFEDDKFGFITHNNTAIVNWMFALDVPVTSHPTAGDVEIYYGNDHSIKAGEKVYDLLYESNNGSFILREDEIQETYSPEHPDMKITSKFGSGDSLFVATKIFALENLRTSEIKYGIVPYPKFDEEQEKYYSHVDGRASFLFVPYTLPESEYGYVGAIVETLSAATAHYVMPVIQKAALLGRYSEDSQAYQMLQDTLAGRSYAFAYFTSGAGGAYWLIQKMMADGSNNLNDYWKPKARVAEREIKTMVSKYAKLK
jgi:hypothetical protein